MTNKIIEKTYQILKETAARGGIISYGELYDRIGVDMKSPSERKRGSDILTELNEISVLENSAMITALVVKTDTQVPGAEFFRLAVNFGELKEDATDEEKIKFWNEELNRVYAIYGAEK